MTKAAIRNDRHYTYEDYLSFPEDERWEIIDGVAYSMAPAPSAEHQNMSMELAAQVHAQLRGKPCKVFAAPLDVRFERSKRTDRVVQPDLLVVCDPQKIVTRGLVGAPDWAVEILSPGSASKDHIVKRRLYEREGVREYWLLHLTDRIVTVYRLGADGHYEQADVHELMGKLTVKAVPGLEIDFDLWEALPEPPA